MANGVTVFARPLPGVEGEKYVRLVDPNSELHIDVQQVESWWVMAAPTGQRFCVVRSSSPRFTAQATEWP